MRAFKDNETVLEECLDLANPRGGFSHFDHIGGAMLAVLQVRN
jgi:hypothetical protein